MGVNFLDRCPPCAVTVLYSKTPVILKGNIQNDRYEQGHVLYRWPLVQASLYFIIKFQFIEEMISWIATSSIYRDSI